MHAVVVPSEDAPKAVLLTTAEAARVAGVSESTIVRNRERLGAVRDGRAFYFREEILRERSTTILKRRSVIIAQEKSDGDVAAAVFQALEDGQTVAQIVIALHVPPETVMNLKDQQIS